MTKPKADNTTFWPGTTVPVSDGVAAGLRGGADPGVIAAFLGAAAHDLKLLTEGYQPVTLMPGQSSSGNRLFPSATPGPGTCR
jgi:hypothetical protein